MRHARVWAALAAGVSLGAAVPAAATSTVRLGQPVMGTVLDVTVVAPERATAERLAQAVLAAARHWDDVLTTWRGDGELARLNARAGHGPVPVSAELAGALRTMLGLRRDTGGAFDPFAGAWVRRWRDGGPPPRVPPRAPALVRSGTAWRVRVPAGVEIDAGGIGKGIALDAAVRALRAGGATAAFLNFGGSSQTAVGAPPDEPRGWPVVVAAAEAGPPRGIVFLKDASLSTSRASGPGDPAGPIVDPRRRVPVAGPRSVTVLAGDATRADAWSTALVVLGPGGLARARAHGLQALVDEGREVVATGGFPLEPAAPAEGRRPGREGRGIRR